MKTEVLKPTLENIERVVEHLRKGEVVALPTETVYGLAGDALESKALTKIFEAKDRPLFDPLIVHISPPKNKTVTLEYLQSLGVCDLTHSSQFKKNTVEKLIQNFWPGPMTLILPRSAKISDLATSGLETVGVRMPQHPVFQQVLQQLNKPLAAPSANRFGRISPTTAQAVLEELDQKVRFIVDGGACQVGVESTILGFQPSEKGEERLYVYRPGGLSLDQIKAVLGYLPDSKLHSENPLAPGMLKTHYSPTKKMVLLSPEVESGRLTVSFICKYLEENFTHVKSVGLLLKSKAQIKESDFHQGKVHFEIEYLSEEQDSREAARNLFAKLRVLDAKAVELIIAETWQDTSGLGFAIQDRLNRAASSS